MDLYSILLGGSLACASVAVVVFVVCIARPDSRQRLSRLARGAAALGLLLGLAATCEHVAFGHRPGSSEGLGAFEFLSEHRALPVAVGLAAVVLACARRLRA